MFQVRRSKSGNRRPSGKLDIIIITVIALLLIAGFAYVIFQIVGHSEEHVDTVRKTKVIYKESLRWRPDSDVCESRITQDLIKYPDKKSGIYSDVNLNENSVRLIAKMSKLEKLDLDRSNLKDEWLSYLTNLPRLTILSVEGNPITEQGIPHILRMNKLVRLSIGDSEVGDTGIELLSAHPSISNLALNLCRSVTNDGVKHLCKMRHLDHLELSSPVSLTGKCLTNLKGADHLVSLNLESMSVEPEDLKALASVKGLSSLDMSNCRVKDPGVVELSKIANLNILNLTGNDLTETGLMSLTKLKKLRALRLVDCPHVDDKALAKFKAAMPRCVVNYSVTSDLSKKMNRKDVKQNVEFLQDEVRQELEKTTTEGSSTSLDHGAW